MKMGLSQENILRSYFLYQDYQKTDMQLSALESGMITMYRNLDEHGRKIVDMVLREEYSRIVEISSEI